MLFRFCLYGFLKNQRYFQPYLMLALLAKGLTFFDIGVLVAVRNASLILFEIPTGSIADVAGRRKCLSLSFVAYILGFVALGTSSSFALLLVAMLGLGVGDAFRTGTHKAMIFAWLRSEGQIDDRTRVYGFTRSWSHIGSAVAVIPAAAFVFTTGDYEGLFLLTVVPYAIALIRGANSGTRALFSWRRAACLPP